MSAYMSLEATSLCAFVFTLIAAERLFSSMNKNVLFQIMSFGERGGTHGASVDFLSSLLCFGLVCETHCAKLSGTLAASFLQLMLDLPLI